MIDALDELIQEVEREDPIAGIFTHNMASGLVSKGVTVQKWIPVTERLPEKQGTYLCRYGFSQFPDYLITGCIDWIAFDKFPHWQHASTGLFVTHWMPLPEPPEGG